MLLRLILVSLVTGLGVQPASPEDLGRWMDEGRACLAEVLGLDDMAVPTACDAQESLDARRAPNPSHCEVPAVELATPVEVAEVAEVLESVPTEAALAAALDATFAEIGEVMAEEFATDQRLMATARETDGQPAVPSFVPAWVDEAAGFEGEAYALNRDADGTSVMIETTPITDETIVPERNQRLAAVLRLTGKALHAWADLLEKGRSTQNYH